MGQWDNLPFELKRLIFGSLEDITEGVHHGSAWRTRGRTRRRESYMLAPLAAVNTQWREAIEAITFKSLMVRTKDVHEFETLFHRNPRRQAALRRVCLLIELLPYAPRLCRTSETEEDLDNNDGTFSDTLWHFFSAMTKWDAEALRCEYKSPGVALELIASSPSDRPDLFGEKGISDNGESRFFESLLDLNIGAMHEPYGCVGLPEVSAIVSLRVPRRNHRCMTSRSLLHIMHSLPRLNQIDLELWHHFSNEAQRLADQDLAVTIAFWPTTPRKLTLFRFNDAFSMEEQFWGHDERYPFLARRLADYSQHLEELAVADFIDADHFFEPFFNPSRRLEIPLWTNLRILALTSRCICSSQPVDTVRSLLHAAAAAARRMPALCLMELYNAETTEGGVFRYLADEQSASIVWVSMWEYRLPADVRDAWAAVSVLHRRVELQILNEETYPGYSGPAWFIHAHLMSRPYLLQPAASHDMLRAAGLLNLFNYKHRYHELMEDVQFARRSRGRDLPPRTRRQHEIEAVQNKLQFLQAELERLEQLGDDAHIMDEDEGHYDHLFLNDPFLDDKMDEGANIQITYPDQPEGADGPPPYAGDDEDWLTE